MVATVPISDIKVFIQNESWELWKAIQDENERRFTVARLAFEKKQKELQELKQAEQTEDLPVVQRDEQNDDINVDDIPF